MRAVATLLTCMLALTGAASAGKYFEVTQTPVVVSLQGVPLSDVRVKFTDEGKQVVENILSGLKVKVDSEEVQVTNVARKIAEAREGNITNEEYVVGALGYEVPEGKYFVGYLQVKSGEGETKKYVVRYEEEQKAVIKSAPGFGSFTATVVQVLGEYDDKGLPLMTPSIDPTEVKDEVLLCLPVIKEITLKPAVLQMDWYKILEKAEPGKVFVKLAQVHAHGEGDKIEVIYAPTKVDALQLLVSGEEPLIPTQEDMVSTIVDPYMEELEAVVDTKIDEFLKPIQEKVQGNPALEILTERFLPTFLKTLAGKQILRVKETIVSALMPHTQYVRTFLVGLYMSQYPDGVNVNTLMARKAAYESPMYEILVSAVKTSYDMMLESLKSTLSNIIDSIVDQYADEIAEMVGTTTEDVKQTVEKLTVGVLKDLLTGDYVDYLIKLVALNVLTSMGSMGIL
ncbi:hypothetical protein [Methanopyrus kandleri]|uniref:Uncharacterized protein specific for M.kandleri, MK-39 family n=2 Tax=Methanopyrus kandleri TaxID=2320 RepID=Q8TVB3_METKA|nr:hypothetical protein [Methanopyrus kandleri]AAM02692.1 Uncharacterized protein specific for M.kandleri, MK-39 family [Methanopyrus kandleri AV19]HII70948.1 hypothetical protein [Methanopyrus kandleri]